MSQEHVTQLLLGYQLGGGEPDEIEAIELHLLTCAECLRASFAIKRQLESAGPSEERPSELTRARLRANVASQLRPAPRRTRLLALGAVAAAAAAAAVGLWMVRPSPHAMPSEMASEQLASQQLIDSGGPIRLAQRL